MVVREDDAGENPHKSDEPCQKHPHRQFLCHVTSPVVFRLRRQSVGECYAVFQQSLCHWWSAAGATRREKSVAVFKQNEQAEPSGAR